jgi:hypothetical protein
MENNEHKKETELKRAAEACLIEKLQDVLEMRLPARFRF